jgi:RNA polymerase sigma factor (sigma-70 family)
MPLPTHLSTLLLLSHHHHPYHSQVMIKANYKLVVSICRKYQGHGMNMGDLINEGIAGLVKGVERFEPAKGFKFSTYAHWWIRQSVSRSLADQGRLVRWVFRQNVGGL